MFSKLTSYLLGNAVEEDASEEEAVNKENEGEKEPALTEVAVEDDEWVLVDHNVKKIKIDESWFVTPPACFTQPSPVHVETSPLEDLLIEHPSMSVYRSAGDNGNEQAETLAVMDKAPPRPKRRRAPMPLTQLTDNFETRPQQPPPAVVARMSPRKSERAEMRMRQQQQQQREQQQQQQPPPAQEQYQRQQEVAEQPPRRATFRDLRNNRGDDSARVVQIRPVQKMLEKRTSQSAKRNRLERANKVREVDSSGKGRRPRRQDRLRLNNSGANNNRKC